MLKGIIIMLIFWSECIHLILFHHESTHLSFTAVPSFFLCDIYFESDRPSLSGETEGYSFGEFALVCLPKEPEASLTLLA